MLTAPDKRQVITEIEDWVKKLHANDKTGHGWDHVQRVRKIAHTIGFEAMGFHQHMLGQTVDLFLIDILALLHETADKKLKLFKNEAQARNQVKQLLEKFQRPPSEIQEIIDTIPLLSYSKSILVDKKITSLAGQVVQDADMLDALGYVGIARAIEYGASQGRPLYDASIPWREVTPENYRDCPTTIHHIKEKLLNLRYHMNTAAGRRLAKPLHEQIEDFLFHFLQQW